MKTLGLTTISIFASLAITISVAASTPAAAKHVHGQVRPSPTPTPVHRPSSTPPVYQPKAAPAPTGTPAMKPPVSTAAGPKVAKLTKASLVGTWVGTVTQGVNKPVANGFRFVLMGSELSGFWLNGSEEKPIASKDMSFTETMFTVKIAGEDYTITFIGYIVENTGDLKGTTFIETLGQKSTGVWTATRKAASAAASPKELVDRGQQLIGQKDYEGAIKLFNQALEADPNYVEAYRMRGIAALLIYEQNPAMQGQKLYTALFNFDHAINRGSTNPDDFYLRGQTHEKIGDNAKAVADYRSTLKLYSGHQGAKDALRKLGGTP